MRQMYRHKRSRQKLVWFLGGIVSTVLVFGLGFFLLRLNAKPSTNSKLQADSSTHVASASSKQDLKEGQNQDSSADAQSEKKPRVITGFSEYQFLDGDYMGGGSIIPDLAHNRIIIHDANGTAHGLPISKMVEEPDGSLLIYADDNIDIRGADGTYITHHSYICLVVAPHGVRMTKNWATGEALEDKSNPSINRFALAGSLDNGQSYDLLRAYTQFSKSDGELFTRLNEH